MKMKFWGCVFVLGLIISAVLAEPISFGWNPSTDTNVVGYDIYYGPSSGDYTVDNEVGNVTNATINVLNIGTNYYTVTSRDTNGLQSPFSNEINYLTPNCLKIFNGGTYYVISLSVASNRIYTVQSSQDMINWVTLTTTAIQTSNQWLNITDNNVYVQSFYRAIENHP